MDYKYRHEIKYRINAGVYYILRQRFRAVTQPDIHTLNGQYRVTSLYFDNIYRSAYYDKVNGVLNRKKYRVRVYNGSEKVIHLEEKIKNDNVGYKKSSVITPEEYRRIINGDHTFLNEERFENSAGEDFFSSSCASPLSPAVIVDYIREPYINMAGNVRLTFDMKISACINNLDLFCKDNIFETVMPDNDIILEVKYDSYLPEHIMYILSGIQAQQESVSKFVLCSDLLGCLKCSAAAVKGMDPAGRNNQ